MSKTKIAPMLTKWLGGGAVYEVDLEKGERELSALKAVARAARVVAHQEPIIMASDVHRLQRALARLRGTEGRGTR